MYGTIVQLIKGDARTLDYSSYKQLLGQEEVHGVCSGLSLGLTLGLQRPAWDRNLP